MRHVIALRTAGENRTAMTVTEYRYPSDEVFDPSEMGLKQCLDETSASFVGA
jgi:hypothetical protein